MSGEGDSVRRNLLTDINDRAVKNFKLTLETLADGRCLLTVMTLYGTVIERIEAENRHEAEQRLCDMGYERIPSFIAFEIDQELNS